MFFAYFAYFAVDNNILVILDRAVTYFSGVRLFFGWHGQRTRCPWSPARASSTLPMPPNFQLSTSKGRISGIVGLGGVFAATGAFVGLDGLGSALGAGDRLAVMLLVVLAELGHGQGEFVFAGLVLAAGSVCSTIFNT